MLVAQRDLLQVNLTTRTTYQYAHRQLPDIAIRGTDFTCTVDELGRSLVILLPDENGISSGEIIVSTGMGSVTLNKPYQATTVSVFENNPTKPVTLDISLELIDNMLIVNPPEQTDESLEQSQTQFVSHFIC